MNRNPAPYPAINIAEPNAAYAKIMLSNIGGPDSELSAVCLYGYNQIITWEHPQLAEVFRSIGAEESHHLELFSRMALQLGADPRPWEYRVRRKKYWSPRYVQYSDKPRKMIGNALYSEYITADRYSQQLKQIGDSGISAILTRILQDEREHIRALKELLRQF